MPMTGMPRCRAMLRPRRSSISNVQFSCSARRIAADSPASRPGIWRSSGGAIERKQICSRTAASGATPARGSPSRSSWTTMRGTATDTNRSGSNESRPIRDSAIIGPASDTISEIRSRRVAPPPTPLQGNRQHGLRHGDQPTFKQGECQILVQAHIQEPAPEWQCQYGRLALLGDDGDLPGLGFAHQLA